MSVKKLLKTRLRIAVEQYYLQQSLEARVSDDELEKFVEHHATIQPDRAAIDGGNNTIRLKAKQNYIIQVKVKKNRAEKAAKGGVGGGIAGFFGGGGAGAGIGALIGIIGGPIGVGIGLAIGAGVGASIGAVSGATGGAGIGMAIWEKDDLKVKNVFPEMGKVINIGDNKYIAVEVELNTPDRTQPI